MPYTVWKGGRTTVAFEQHRYERLEEDAQRAELKRRFEQLGVVRTMRDMKHKAEMAKASTTQQTAAP